MIDYNTMSDNNVVVTPSEKLTGRVKWFNNQAGYGFINVTDGEKSGTDIFVHHSTLKVESQQYKYLIQGEYVEFELVKSSGGNHEWQAFNVIGVKGGKLMCETRHEFNIARTSYKSNDLSEPSYEPRQQREPRPHREPRQPRVRGEGPRDSSTAEKKEWTLVKQNLPPAVRGRGIPRRKESEIN